jgi:tetratricopeptide (TPR) repeat protein
MKSAGICFALLVMLAPCAISGQTTAAEQKPSPIDSADRLFRIGEFAQAGEQYAKIAADHPDDYSATLQLGRIALLSNRLDDAEHWLKRAIDLRPGDADPKVMLAEAYYRRDDFEKAVAALNGVDVGTNPLVAAQYPTLNVAKLQSFKGQTPYEVHGDGQITRLKFLRTDPLPLITVRDHCRRLDGEEPARCDATPPPALRRPWREADRRYHRDHSLLPFCSRSSDTMA